MLSSLLGCIHLFVFFLSLKNCFVSSLTASRQIAIYQDPWTSFLNRFYRIFNPSSYLEFVSIIFRQILDPSRKFLFGRQLLDSCSIHRVNSVVDKFSTAPQQIYLSRISARQNLDRSSIHRDAFSLNRFSVKLDFIYLVLSRQKLFFHLPNTFFSLKTSYPLGFQPCLSISPLVCSLNPSFFMHFTHLDLGFGFS